ncbi:MAG: hypothetical protein NXI16_04800 [Alphaproteobacteria bacterium]|nr:hypothetical protein [Alphaproteobacteria bacterium]
MRARFLTANLCSIVASAALSVSATAGEWRVDRLDPGAFDRVAFAETGAPAPNGLPDGSIARHAGGDIRAAWYEAPTNRYRHAILGDGIEAGVLAVETADGRVLRHVLDDLHVFEDRTPRLADLDGDGRVEVIAIRASLVEGGALAVYGVDGDTLVERAVAGSIGRANRWLNIAGIDDFLGAGDRQIAYVKTPHIGGTLYVYRFQDGQLSRVGSLYGFSNHAIGAREQRLSAVADINGDGNADLAVPSADRRDLRLVGFVDGALTEFAAIKLPARVETAILTEGSGPGLAFLVGLSDGAIYRISR